MLFMKYITPLNHIQIPTTHPGYLHMQNILATLKHCEPFQFIFPLLLFVTRNTNGSTTHDTEAIHYLWLNMDKQNLNWEGYNLSNAKIVGRRPVLLSNIQSDNRLEYVRSFGIVNNACCMPLKSKSNLLQCEKGGLYRRSTSTESLHASNNSRVAFGMPAHPPSILQCWEGEFPTQIATGKWFLTRRNIEEHEMVAPVSTIYGT